MNRSIELLLAISFLFVFGSSNAQQDAQFSQYMLNNMYTNPAFAGLEECPNFTLIHRSQWVGYEGGNPPQGQSLTASVPIRFLRGGLGLQLENDEIGPLRKINLLFSYSYHIKIANGKLGIGLRSGLANTSVNKKYKYSDPDPYIPTGLSQIIPDYSLGLFYNHFSYYIGASLNHLLREKINILNTKQSQQVTVTGGYNYQFASNISITPSFILKYDEGVGARGGIWSSDVSLMTTFNTKYWIGASYRKNDAIILLSGVNLLKNNSLKLGFAYDYTLINQSAKANSSFEILLSYNLPPISELVKPIIRSPRYRFE